MASPSLQAIARHLTASLPCCLVLGALGGCAEAPTSPGDLLKPSFIINGSFDGTSHPYVGAMLYDFGGDGVDGTDLLCSGVLIAPTVFLTAAHCVLAFPQGTDFWVSFDPDLLDDPAQLGSLIKVSSAAADPQYKSTALGGNIHDLGVLILPVGSTAGITPAQLPTAGLLEAMDAAQQLRKTDMVQVGYGVSASTQGHPAFPWDGRRNAGTAPVQSLASFQLLLFMNVKATGQSGDCYGDSGSPKLLPGTNTIVSITSWGDAPCRAISWSYRLDTGSARDFLSGFVTLP
jgi:hypothetical protein